MTLNLNIHSATHGTGGRGTFYASLEPNHVYRNNPDNDPVALPKNYTVEFDGTHCGHRVASYYDARAKRSIDMIMNDDIERYEGFREMRFTYEGMFDVSLYVKGEENEPTHVGKTFIVFSDATPMIDLRIFELTTVLGAVGLVGGSVALLLQYRQNHPR